MPADDEALRYYLDELTYLRTMGSEFARAHDKVAALLDLSAGHSTDPHVERLIESFAFLTGRIQRNLDSEFPQITSALLGVLYPHLMQPVPPMAIARFDVDPVRAKVPTGYLVQKNTPLIARSVDGLPCRFRTCYPVLLWPVEVREAAIEPARFAAVDEPGVTNVIRLRLRCMAGKMSDLKDLTQLRFFLNGPPAVTSLLYDLLVTAVVAVHLRPPWDPDEKQHPEPVRLPRGVIRQAGFAPDEDVLPSLPQSHPGYRLIQEYFHFPDKFRFLDIRKLDQRPPGEEFEILFLLNRAPNRLPVNKNNFVLGCTPIVNLFRKTSEPIRVDHRALEYRLVGDFRRERTTEIYSIESVSASSNPEEKAVRYEPFYSYRHSWEGAGNRAFWLARRAPTGRTEVPGTDLWLSFLNLDFRPEQPADEIVYAHTLCSNRRLALELRENAELQIELQIETPAPTHSISCIVRPTPPGNPAMGGATVWRLISNLSLNHLSLESSGEGVEALREVLRIHALIEGPSVRRQIDGIRKVSRRRVLRRFGPNASRGFRTGTEVVLEFDESMFTGSSAILLASMLRHFLALHTSINSFVQVSARRQTDEPGYFWKRWTPRAGEQPVL